MNWFSDYSLHILTYTLIVQGFLRDSYLGVKWLFPRPVITLLANICDIFLPKKRLNTRGLSMEVFLWLRKHISGFVTIVTLRLYSVKENSVLLNAFEFK